jgi:hypothetical protein
MRFANGSNLQMVPYRVGLYIGVMILLSITTSIHKQPNYIALISII